MSHSRKSPRPIFVLLGSSWSRVYFVLLLLLVGAWAMDSANAQSGAPAQSEPAPQNRSQAITPSGSQPATIPQATSNATSQSLADAARKANAQKDKPKSKHVFTNDDIENVGGTISVVGNGSSVGTPSGNVNSNSQDNVTATSDAKDEAFWRGRARPIKDQIAAVDQQIGQKKDEIAKAGPASFDPSTGLSQNVIIIHDRNAELRELEERKERLEKQLDDLADEGRKAGADSGWFR